MSASKRSRPSAGPPKGYPAWTARFLAFCWGPGRTGTLLVLLAAGFSAAATLVWYRVAPRVRASRQYALTLDQVYVTPPPPWIHSDVRAEVFRSASLDPPLSLLQDGLADRIFKAFAMHPWVARVDHVTMVSQHPPHRVDVELVYRQPACMVQVADDLLPVDAEGVLLPGGDFSPIEKQRDYACLAGIDTRPMRPVGQPWGDGRVLDGAQIAAAFGPIWQQLQLYRVQPSPASLAAREPIYELLTRAGTCIVWGLAPGTKVLGELPPAEKIARLQQYAAGHGGGLDVQGNTAPLDLRTLPPAKSR
ncbi:MAG: hypothetical protein ABSG86_03765 [Thermoguttaceae bacterium]